jgi:glycosyltransferase involved in cell wall biosynthesis
LIHPFGWSVPMICLNMIVRNEAHVMRRCLDSIGPFIDRWVIVDTGSTDGTQEIIREYMRDIPGKLFERPWKNFAHNRSEAFTLAKDEADYLLLIDADEQLAVPANWKLPELTQDCYNIEVRLPSAISFSRAALLATRLPWRFIGVVHEYSDCGRQYTTGTLKGAYLWSTFEGSRNRNPDKYKNDALLLEEALREEPSNARYMFYLAESYRGNSEWKKAHDAYLRRTTMGGSHEEIWFSHYQAAQMSTLIETSEGANILLFLKAYEARPIRAETLHSLAYYCRSRNLASLGYMFAKAAAAIPQPSGDSLFVRHDVYAWRTVDEWSVNAFNMGRFQEAKQLLQRLLENPHVAPEERPRIKNNFDATLKRLG